MINMGALAIDQLFQNAQDKGVQLALETSTLENQVSHIYSIYSLLTIYY